MTTPTIDEAELRRLAVELLAEPPMAEPWRAWENTHHGWSVMASRETVSHSSYSGLFSNGEWPAATGERRARYIAACHPRAVLALLDELARLRAILDAPLVALFADGREPSTNERHLLSLLSWRESENAQHKEEIARLRGMVDTLAKEAPKLQKIISDMGESRARAWTPRPAAEWTEEDGDVLWWSFPVVEAPFVGTPDMLEDVDEDGLPLHYTHWTPIVVPVLPEGGTR